MGKNQTSFKKGQVANPAGRPKKEWTWSGLIRDIGEENPENSVLQNKDIAIKALWAKSKRGDVMALKEIGNRLDGLPQQKVDVTSGGKPIPLLGGATNAIQEDNGDGEDSKAK